MPDARSLAHNAAARAVLRLIDSKLGQNLTFDEQDAALDGLLAGSTLIRVNRKDGGFIEKPHDRKSLRGLIKTIRVHAKTRISSQELWQVGVGALKSEYVDRIGWNERSPSPERVSARAKSSSNATKPLRRSSRAKNSGLHPTQPPSPASRSADEPDTSVADSTQKDFRCQNRYNNPACKGASSEESRNDRDFGEKICRSCYDFKRKHNQDSASSADSPLGRSGLGTMELATDVDAIDELGDSSMQTTSDTLGARDSEPSAPTFKEPATTVTVAVPNKRRITTNRAVESDAPTALQPSDMQLLGELRHPSLPSEKSAISGAPGTSRKNGLSGSETLQESPTIDMINADAGARSKEQRRKTAPEATTTVKSDLKRNLLDLGYRSEPVGSSQSKHVSGTKRVFSATESASETLSPSTHQQSVKKKVKATASFFEAKSSQNQSRDAVLRKWGNLFVFKDSLRDVPPTLDTHIVATDDIQDASFTRPDVSPISPLSTARSAHPSISDSLPMCRKLFSSLPQPASFTEHSIKPSKAKKQSKSNRASISLRHAEANILPTRVDTVSPEFMPRDSASDSNPKLLAKDMEIVSEHHAFIPRDLSLRRIELDYAALGDDMDQIRVNMSSVLRHFFELAGASRTQAAIYAKNPPYELNHVYSVAFGTERANITREMQQSLASMSAIQALQALTGAFIFDKVFCTRIDWSEQCAHLARYRTSMYAMCRTLAKDFEFDWDLFDRQLQARKAHCEDFHEQIVAPLADWLAKDLCRTLNLHIALITTTNGIDNESYNSLLTGLQDCIKRALIVRYKLEMSDPEHEYLWYTYGEPLNRKLMNEIHKAKGSDYNVLFSVLPGIQRVETKDVATVADVRALVVLR